MKKLLYQQNGFEDLIPENFRKTELKKDSMEEKDVEYPDY
jgi:hypothetical protein